MTWWTGTTSGIARVLPARSTHLNFLASAPSIGPCSHFDGTSGIVTGITAS